MLIQHKASIIGLFSYIMFNLQLVKTKEYYFIQSLASSECVVSSIVKMSSGFRLGNELAQV